MKQRPLAVNLNRTLEIPYDRQLELICTAGFDGFFFLWDPALDLDSLMKKAQSLGLTLQSIHAPFRKAADFWQTDPEKGQAAIEELMSCVDACVQCGTDLLVVHPLYLRRCVRRA